MPRRLININLTGAATPRVAFVRSPQNALLIDVISWANNDSAQAHWPAPVIDNVVQQDGFMPQAIPPDASSPDFVPSAEGSVPYVCVLHPAEKGVLNVVASLSLETPPTPPPAPAPRATATAPTPRPKPKPKAMAKPKLKAKPKPKAKAKPKAKRAKAKAKRSTKKKSK